MQVDAHFWASVAMPDAGNAGPDPTERRSDNSAVVGAYRNLERWAATMDGLGYDTMWLTEHHFQHEGYEVVPNMVQTGLHLAGRTRRLRFGQMFNVVPQWHPLRLAEDVAAAQILSRDRMVFGVGRGTVPRETYPLGGVVASGDNAMSAELDRRNREAFEEAMEVIKLAWTRERFSYSGKHFTLPPTGIPDRGGEVTELTLVPRPIAPITVWQPVTSPGTLAYAPAVGHHAVIPARSPHRTAETWHAFAEVAARHGWDLEPGEARCLVLNAHVGATREAAFARVRDAHDEWVQFLAPYGRFRHYAGPDGAEVPFDFRPTLEESVDQGVMAIGSADDVVDALGRFGDELGLRHVCLFLEFPGLSADQVDEQLHLVADEVIPRLG